MKYTSNAEWPSGVCCLPSRSNITTDTHSSKKEAEAVCRGLVEHGFGGMGQDFPVCTWVEELKDAR